MIIAVSHSLTKMFRVLVLRPSFIVISWKSRLYCRMAMYRQCSLVICYVPKN